MTNDNLPSKFIYLAILMGPLYISFYYYFENVPVLVIITVAWLFAVVVWLLNRFHKLTENHLRVATACIPLLAFAPLPFFFGGMTGLASAWVIVPPLTAYLLDLHKLAIFSFIISLLTTIGAAVCQIFFHRDLLYFSFTRNDTQFYVVTLFLFLGVLGLTFLYTMVFYKAEKTATNNFMLRSRDIQAILENIPLGVFLIQPDMTVHKEHSKFLRVIMSKARIGGENWSEFLFSGTSITNNDKDQCTSAIELSLGETAMNFELNKHLLFREITRTTQSGEQHLELDWNPILDNNNNVGKMLVTVRDVTELQALKSKSTRQSAELIMIGEILNCGVENFSDAYRHSIDYISRNKRIVESPDFRLQDDLQEVFRNVHTVKGIVRTLALSFAVNIIHEIEHEYAVIRKSAPVSIDKGKVLHDLQNVEKVLNNYNSLAGTKLTGQFSHNSLAYCFGSRALELFQSANEPDASAKVEFFDQMHSLYYKQSLAAHLHPVLKSLPDFARRGGKEPPIVEISDHGLVFKAEKVSYLKDLLIHLFTNALDHGLETPQERKKNGKRPAGKINVNCIKKDTSVDLMFFDDGRGLDLPALRQKAIPRMGLQSTASDVEVANVIFEFGVSTTSQVTDTSGRGVGLNAVRTLVMREGGSISIDFSGKEDGGFRKFKFVIRLPADSMLA